MKQRQREPVAGARAHIVEHCRLTSHLRGNLCRLVLNSHAGMELRTTSARGSDTNCRGLFNQVSSRRGRQADRRKVCDIFQSSKDCFQRLRFLALVLKACDKYMA